MDVITSLLSLAMCIYRLLITNWESTRALQLVQAQPISHQLTLIFNLVITDSRHTTMLYLVLDILILLDNILSYYLFSTILKEVRLSENLITDPARGGVPRFVLIARLAKIQILNGSEISPRERKDSEIRYVRLVISRSFANPEEIKQHPRFSELKKFYGIEEERTSTGTSGPQTMASGLLSITLKSVGPSMGEKPPLTKKLPATTTIGKLKLLCESFFKLQCVKLNLYLQEEGSPMPLLLDNDMATFFDLGIGNESIILVDEER